MYKVLFILPCLFQIFDFWILCSRRRRAGRLIWVLVSSLRLTRNHPPASKTIVLPNSSVRSDINIYVNSVMWPPCEQSHDIRWTFFVACENLKKVRIKASVKGARLGSFPEGHSFFFYLVCPWTVPDLNCSVTVHTLLYWYCYAVITCLHHAWSMKQDCCSKFK